VSLFEDGLSRYLEPSLRDRLRKATVGIAGAGGLGSNCAVLLARSGVGRFVLVDHDVVEPSNLNRQHYLAADVGRPKAEALADVLRAINPAVDLVVHVQQLEDGNIIGIFGVCDVVVEAVDDAATKRMLAETLMGAGRPVVCASGMGGWGGPPMRERHLGESMVVVGDFTNEVGPGLPPLAPRVVMAAAMQADAVLARLLGPCPAMNHR